MMQNEKELIVQFVAAAIDAVATVEIIPNDVKILTVALVKATEDDEAVLFAEPNDLDANLFSEFKKNPKVITNPTKEQLKTVRTGVTDSFGAAASTGSVCVPITNSLISPISMLTRKHIVVLDGNSIVPRPGDLFSEKYLDGKGLKRSFSFITGTSATADMGPLVRGVHGPGKLHIIVLE
jgi:L-lactate dehydrogenase complex protein LldG